MDKQRQTILVVFALILEVYGSEVCYTTEEYEYYCDDGYYCCENDTKCCRGAKGTSLSVGAIVGIVLGSIAFMCCCVGVRCACAKMKNKQEKVQPVQQPGAAVVVTEPQQNLPGYGQHVYGQQQLQHVYGQQQLPHVYGQQQFGFPQPTSADKAGTSDAAYPPPAYSPCESKVAP